MIHQHSSPSGGSSNPRGIAGQPLFLPAPRAPVRARRISPCQEMAWSVANMGYDVPDGSLYREHARLMYEQDRHDRIQALFDSLDRQNAAIDEALRGS